MATLSPIQYTIIGQGSSGENIKNTVCMDVSDAYWGLDQLLSIHGIKTPKGFGNWKVQKHSPSGKKYSRSNLFLVVDKGSIANKFETYRIGSIPQFLTLEELQKQRQVPKVSPVQTSRNGWEKGLFNILRNTFPSYSEDQFMSAMYQIFQYLEGGWHLILLTDENHNLRIVASVERGKGRELRPLVKEFYAKRKKEEN